MIQQVALVESLIYSPQMNQRSGNLKIHLYTFAKA